MQGTESGRTRDGILAASGAAAMLAVLLVVQSLLGSGLLSFKTVTVTTSNPNDQVAKAYADHLLLLPVSGLHTSELASEYEANATIGFTGIDVLRMGNISGSNNIGIALGSFVSRFVNFSMSAESQSIEAEGNVAVVNSTLIFRAYSSGGGEISGKIVAQDVYEHAGSSWLIARETWDFTQVNQQ